MPQMKGFQTALWNVVEKFQNASNNIECNLIPLFHNNSVDEDQTDLKLLAQQQIVENVELALQNIGLRIDIWLHAKHIQNDPTKADSIILVESQESVEILNHEVNTENEVGERTTSDGPCDGNNEGDDDDVTIFLPKWQDHFETQSDKHTINETFTFENEQNTNELSILQSSDKQVNQGCDIAACSQAVRTELKSNKETNSDFQDTPTSVVDYRNYNENGMLPFGKESLLMDQVTRKEKVEFYLKTLDAGNTNFSDSQESSFCNDIDDDNISSVTNTLIQTKHQSDSTCETVDTLLVGNNNQENLPLNNSDETPKASKRPDIAGNQIEGNKIDKGKFIQDENDHFSFSSSSSDIEIIKDLDKESVEIPILLNSESNEGKVDEQLFSVDPVEDEQSISILSMNLLKTEKERINIEKKKEDRSTISTIKGKVEIETVDSSNVKSKILTAETSKETTQENNENVNVDSCINTAESVGSNEALETPVVGQSSVRPSEKTDEISDKEPNKRRLPDIDLILSSDDEWEEESMDKMTKNENNLRHGMNIDIVEKMENTENNEENKERAGIARDKWISYSDGDSIIKQKYVHIIDDFTIKNETMSVLSHDGNFIYDNVNGSNDEYVDCKMEQEDIRDEVEAEKERDEADVDVDYQKIGVEDQGDRQEKEEDENKKREDINHFDVIPSVKVEVVIKEENDMETDNPSLNVINTSPTFNKVTHQEKTKAIHKGPFSMKNDRSQVSLKRKSCQLDILQASPEVFSRNNSQDSGHVFKKPGPKSRTSHGKKPANSIKDNEKDRLTNVALPNKPSSGLSKCAKLNTSGVKKNRRKKPSLLDFLPKARLESSSAESNTTEDDIDSEHPLREFITNTNMIDITKRRILDSDEESLLSSISPYRNAVPGPKISKKKGMQTSRTFSKPGTSWRKDPLLTGRLDSQPSKKSNSRNKSYNESLDDNDDVLSVCSQIQEVVENLLVKEELQKLVEERETVIPTIAEVICISSDDEEEDEIDELLNNEEDDLNSVLNETEERQLVMEFQKTANSRKQRVSTLQKRAQYFLNSSRICNENSSDVAAFEDRYNDVPPLVLDMNEESADMISVCPFFSKVLKDHQKRGVQFMWDTCFGSKKKVMEDDRGSGCILAHGMGLGKSVQVISLLHTLKSVEDFPLKKIIILSPKSLVQNWEAEITKWTKGLRVKLSLYSWANDDNLTVENIHKWSAFGGVFIFSYKLFVNVCKRTKSVDFKTFFLDPGADIVIFDEGHLLKNKRSETYKCLLQFRTRRRIALTGTPIQNNLEELYNIVSLVQPDFMSKDKFQKDFCYPISLAQNDGATTSERTKAAKRISCLHKELETVMDREECNQEAGLPPKLNYDIFLQLGPIQEKLVMFFYDRMRECFIQPMIFPSVRIAEMISIHPKSLEGAKPVETLCKGRDWNEELKKGHDWHEDLKGAWWKNVLSQEEIEQLNAIEAGVKIKVTFRIIEHAAQKKEKVLVFCSSIQILDLLESFLQQRDFVKNVNFFRMDGHVTVNQRRKYINIFNNENNAEARVFLLTHKVGGVGLNFTGANRIVILDMPWNPSHHEQSSNRTHRLGQKKTSYVYRLITKGTLEESIYHTTISKQSLSKRVVDKKKIKALFLKKDTFAFEFKRPQCSRRNLRLSNDDVLNAIIQDHSGLSMIYSYTEQGELFELSEEHLNEGQAYEEYLMECHALTVPEEEEEEDEKKKKKKRGKRKAENVLSGMMSQEHLMDYNHVKLLRIMQGFGPHQQMNPTSHALGSNDTPPVPSDFQLQHLNIVPGGDALMSNKIPLPYHETLRVVPSTPRAYLPGTLVHPPFLVNSSVMTRPPPLVPVVRTQPQKLGVNTPGSRSHSAQLNIPTIDPPRNAMSFSSLPEYLNTVRRPHVDKEDTCLLHDKKLVKRPGKSLSNISQEVIQLNQESPVDDQASILDSVTNLTSQGVTNLTSQVELRIRKTPQGPNQQVDVTSLSPDAQQTSSADVSQLNAAQRDNEFMKPSLSNIFPQRLSRIGNVTPVPKEQVKSRKVVLNQATTPPSIVTEAESVVEQNNHNHPCPHKMPTSDNIDMWIDSSSGTNFIDILKVSIQMMKQHTAARR